MFCNCETFQVNINKENQTYECSCLVFKQYGFLCRHIFCILRNRFIEEIPEKYFLRRWQKGIIKPEDLRKTYATGGSGTDHQKKVYGLYAILAECVGLTSHNHEAVEDLEVQLKAIRDKILLNSPEKDTRSKNEILESFLGFKKPAVVTIQNPKNIMTKGMGAGGKRKKGQREIALQNEPRGCAFCKKKISPKDKHDTRNCPVRKKLEEEAKLKKRQESDAANGV